MKLKIKNVQGKVVGNVDVRDDVFAVPMNTALVHQVMVGQLANSRQGTASTKNRSAVSGGGAKPWVQKHTGRARAGTTRAPQWKGGGVAFGPAPRSYRHHTPKRMRRLSTTAVLSEKIRENRLVVLDELALEQTKTKEMVKILDALDASPPVLLVVDGTDQSALRCARNIPSVKTLPAALLNTLDLLNHRNIVMTVDAVHNAERLWGGPFVRQRRPVAETSEN